MSRSPFQDNYFGENCMNQSVNYQHQQMNSSFIPQTNLYYSQHISPQNKFNNQAQELQLQNETHNQLSFYELNMMKHLFATITPSHPKHIRFIPYVKSAINSLSYLIFYLNQSMNPNFAQLQENIKKEVIYAKNLFQSPFKACQDESSMFYELQSCMVILISVYKCFQNSYDSYRRKLLKKLCISLRQLQFKNILQSLRWLQNNRLELKNMESPRQHASKINSGIFEIYKNRNKFLKPNIFDEIPSLSFLSLTKSENRRRKIANIWISGFLSEDMDKKSHWQALSQAMPDSQIYAIHWSSDKITNLVKFIGKSSVEILTAEKIREQLHRKYTDNPFIPASQMARIFGRYLAQIIILYFPHQFVNLVGYSLGSEMIVSCLEHLIQLKKESCLNTIYILGGVSDCSNLEDVISRAQYPLSIYNCYTSKDLVLKHILSLCIPKNSPLGLTKINSIAGHQINNLECSDLVSGHLSYMLNFKSIGLSLEMNNQ